MAEYLANCAIYSEEGELFFPDEEVMKMKEDLWTVHFDGVANQKGYGVRIILVILGGVYTPLTVKLRYTSTNNIAKVGSREDIHI